MAKTEPGEENANLALNAAVEAMNAAVAGRVPAEPEVTPSPEPTQTPAPTDKPEPTDKPQPPLRKQMRTPVAF